MVAMTRAPKTRPITMATVAPLGPPPRAPDQENASPVPEPKRISHRKYASALQSPVPMDSPFIRFRPFIEPTTVKLVTPQAGIAGAGKLFEAIPFENSAAAASPIPNHKIHTLNKSQELSRAQEIAKQVKKPVPPTPAKPNTDEEPTAAPEFEALPSGTRLRVWWEGSQDYYDCVIINWRVAIGKDGNLFYTHRCQYDGGVFDHDLAKADWEVVDIANAWTYGAEEDGDESGGEAEEEDAKDMMAPPANIAELSPKRRWLAKQELKLAQFQEELEAADIGTPLKEQPVVRGRVALRRIRQPNAQIDKVCVTPRVTLPLKDSDIKIVDPSDAGISYRLCTGMTAGLGAIGEQS